MAIRYEAYTWSGEKVSGVLETDSEADAYEKLQQEQLIPYRLAPIRPRRPLVRLAPSLFKPKPKDIIDFTRQLASLIESGIPLLRALSAQYDQTNNAGLKYAIEDVIERVQAGDRLSEATARHPSVFPGSYSRLLRITEETGGIGETLRQLADSMEKNKAVKDRVKGALMYPAITLFLAIGAIFVLVKFSLPSLVNMLEDFGGEMPATTRLMITITDGLQGSSLNILIIGGVAVGLTILYTRSTQGARRRDQLLLRLPVIGNVLVASNMFFFTSSFVTLLEAGIAPTEALRLTGQGMTNAVFREQLAAATTKASEGMRLGTPSQSKRCSLPCSPSPSL